MNVSSKVSTAIGFIAILLWSTLALFTKLTSGIPAFQLLFMTFVIGGLVNSVALYKARGRIKQILCQPFSVWLFVVGGLFFYHLFYFIALASAPVVEAGLIAYLWPLLIVLMSALLPGENLRWFHVLGGVVAFMGAMALILLKGKGNVGFEWQYLKGYLFALACALTWSAYSVFNRRYTHVPSMAIAGFCLGVAGCALLVHLSFETWIIPSSKQWLGVVCLGLGPVGAAFFVWDYGTKHGNIQVLGTLSYFAPLLSTLLLIIFGGESATIGVLIGCLLIVFGALIAVNPLKK